MKLFDLIDKYLNKPSEKPLEKQVNQYVKGFFRAYTKPGYQFKHDVLQPLTGLWNVLFTVYNIFTANCCFIADLLKGENVSYWQHIKLQFYYTGIIYKGIAQILTTPLTWMIKMPLRCLLTLIVGRRKIENTLKVSKLLSRVDDYSKKYADLLAKDLHEIFVRNYAIKKQKTSINSSEEAALYAGVARINQERSEAKDLLWKEASGKEPLDKIQTQFDDKVKEYREEFMRLDAELQSVSIKYLVWFKTQVCQPQMQDQEIDTVSQCNCSL